MNAFIFLAAIAAAQTGERLTVDQAIAIAIQDAFSVRTSQVAEARAQDLVDLAKAGAGLNINLQGAYQRLQQRDVKSSAFGGGFGPARDTGTVSLNVTQVVDVSGAVRKAVNQARLNREAARYSTEAQRNLIRNQVRGFSYAVLQAQEGVTIAEDEVKAAQERLDKAQIRYRNEAIARFDVLRLETDLRRAQQALVDARANVVLAKQNLNDLLGRPIDTPFEMEPVPGKPDVTADASALTAKALSTRPDIIAAEKNLAGLGEALKRERLGMAPQVVLNANHSETLTEVTTGGAKGTTVGALQVTLPLFDSNLTRTKVRSAQKDVEQASILLEQARLGAALEIRAALTRLQSTNEGYEVAMKTEELARETLRLAQLRYDEGVGILVDVTTAQAQLTAARSAVVNARYAYLAALADLQRAVGTDDLSPSASKEVSK